MDNSDAVQQLQNSNVSNESSTSQCYSISNESDLSFSINTGHMDSNGLKNNNDEDELPTFDIRSIAPLSRSPSPIDMENFLPRNAEIEMGTLQNVEPKIDTDAPHDYVSLQDLNAQISPPKEASAVEEKDETANLETIYEGIYLHTPPRHRKNFSFAQSRINISSSSTSSISGSIVRSRLSSNDSNVYVPSSKFLRRS